MTYLCHGPIIKVLEWQRNPLAWPPARYQVHSYVVLPQPRWSGEKIMAPKTVKALPRSARVREWSLGTRWSFKTCQCPAKAGEACPLTAEECGARTYGEGGALAKDHRQAEAKAMTVHDAEPGDVYVDDGGKLWRCVSICHEPTVTMEEVEPTVVHDPGMHHPTTTKLAKLKTGGGVSGLMWNGWQRIWRKEQRVT